MAAIQGVPRNYFKKFAFVVEFGGTGFAGLYVKRSAGSSPGGSVLSVPSPLMPFARPSLCR